MTFWAHSDRSGLPPEAPGANWQPLAEHLTKVGSLARKLASFAAPSGKQFQDLAEWAGLLHDYGKYTDCFQQRIRTGKGKCPHAIHGAAMAFSGSAERPALRAAHVAMAIAGHHAGIPDHSRFRDQVRERRKEAVELLERARRDLPAIGTLLDGEVPKLEDVSSRFDLFTRMLFSCLVDADRLDTARRPVIQAPLEANTRLERLLQHIAGLRSGTEEVQAIRREVLNDCLAAAEWPEPLLSLSVPTGGGKTLAGMAFALKRAAVRPDKYRRIIIVIPYLSIIEQNAEVYGRIFGTDAILEHHSGSPLRLAQKDKHHFGVEQESEDDDQASGQRPETENWDAPLIVTTSVRFFESLFSNRPSDLRRVHNIARSIVILDEVQVLPRRLLAPLLEIMDELTRDWGCAFVLATATKPAFEKQTPGQSRDKRWEPGRVREIVRSPEDLHKRLRRVTIDWRIHETVDWPEVAGWMNRERQALCVVNVRDHAAKLFDELGSAAAHRAGLFHLSTRMCPAHRLQKIAEIRARLQNNLPCLVVSTQLIEAGVDLDFPVTFRALGPLDSIVQVAGRADREGKLTAALGAPGGRLIVFKPEDHKMPPNDYEHAAGVTESLAKTKDIQTDDLDSMAAFFERYYSEADLGTAFLDMRKLAQFPKLAEEFEMISSRTQDVFVPYGDGKPLVEELLRTRQLYADLRRKLQRFVVGLQPWEFQTARKQVLTAVDSEERIWIAVNSAYDLQKGLKISLEMEDYFA
ncbi:MAG TPA: CRISPR-associated helicase Cas3' [Bryobacteraceae bacterium]|nr:CRISPR-associated helicase Cas3' [Bryobacteraceae bacterium]